MPRVPDDDDLVLPPLPLATGARLPDPDGRRITAVALVVTTELLSSMFYPGTKREMLVPNQGRSQEAIFFIVRGDQPYKFNQNLIKI